jgi:hydrogenase-4 membrane subunit HyfE
MYEPENRTDVAENTGPALTLGNLLMVTSFMITVMAVINPIKHAGGGVVRYMLSVPLALALGALIVWLNWKVQKYLFQRAKGATKRTENTIVAIFLLSLPFFIALGGFAGGILASLLMKLLA